VTYPPETGLQVSAPAAAMSVTNWLVQPVGSVDSAPAVVALPEYSPVELIVASLVPSPSGVEADGVGPCPGRAAKFHAGAGRGVRSELVAAAHVHPAVGGPSSSAALVDEYRTWSVWRKVWFSSMSFVPSLFGSSVT